MKMVFRKLRYRFEIIEGHIVRITHLRQRGGEECWNIYLENVFWGGEIVFPMPVDREARNRILWLYDLTDDEFRQTGEYRAKGEAAGVIAVYSDRRRNRLKFILFTTHKQMYKRFIHFSHRREKVRLTRNCLKLRFEGRLYSLKKPDIPPICRAELTVDQNHVYQLKLPLVRYQKGRFRRTSIKVPLESIVSQETMINNPIHITVWVENEELEFNIGHKTKWKKPSKYGYVPITSMYYADKALFVRGNVNQNWTLVVRGKDPVECSRQFRRRENRWISAGLYHIGRAVRILHRKNVNLYFEKDSMKAEEGTFEIFRQAVDSDKSRNYFILDAASEDWGRLSAYENVIEKYSWKYYWLLYTADYLISTETSSHLNVHRALNSYVRRALLKPKLIFLQHGVTYMKRQGAGSVFGKGKEGEPEVIIVDSGKEADIVAKMLKIPRERCVDAGLPIFSTIEYGHIGQNSPDNAVIMLTWKPSEEHLLTHFEDSTYYQFTRKLYDRLKLYLSTDRIRIVPHPKVREHLMRTDLAKVMWTGTVAEVLGQTKLLITDYSSVCYNAFYQGAAVIFYQEDLEAYEKEVGKLIPAAEEYIGYRFFDIDRLDFCLREGITEQRIRLDVLRTEEFRQRYLEINRHHDGKNVERIAAFLRSRNVI